MAPSNRAIGPIKSIKSLITRTIAFFFIQAFLTLTLASTPALAAKYAAIVIEENTGQVLFARNPDSLRYPASLTKIMTLYLLFEDIDAGRINLNNLIPVSKVAAGRSPSKLYLNHFLKYLARNQV